MRTLMTIMAILSLCAISYAADPQPELTMKMVGSDVVPDLPEEYQGWKWVWFDVSDNFEVLAITEKDGRAIAKRSEALKSWINRRWGFSNDQYKHKCMIICVPNKELFKKWFRRNDIDPKLAMSKNDDGSDRPVYGVWISADDRFLSSVLPEKIGRVNLLDYEKRHNTTLGNWAHVGMCALNNDLLTVRKMLGGQYQSYPVRVLFGDEDARPILESETGVSYRARAAALCLMLRKMHGGGETFKTFLFKASGEEGPERALSVYGFEAYDSFQLNYDRYVSNLAFDIENNKTPDMGLTWFTSRTQKLFTR